MLQAHNRQMSISLYIAMLAVSDTTVLLSGRVSIDQGSDARSRAGGGPYPELGSIKTFIGK